MSIMYYLYYKVYYTTNDYNQGWAIPNQLIRVIFK